MRCVLCGKLIWYLFQNYSTHDLNKREYEIDGEIHVVNHSTYHHDKCVERYGKRIK